MVAFVLRFFSGREVHWGSAIIAAVSTGGVARCAGAGWGYLSGSWVGIMGVAREVSMGSDSVVEFHT
jgi:hypothetical protein